MKRIMLVAFLLAFSVGYIRAAQPPDRHADLAAEMQGLDPEVRRLTVEALRRKNAFYEQDGLANQTKKGEVFTYARVEVAGVMSSDNTADYDKDLFERYIKPSFSVRQSGLRGLLGGPINDALRKLFPPIKNGEDIRDTALDIEEFSAAAAGVTTDRAREKLAPYRDAEINELVAHSWGTELIYSAILNGEIRPPKRLIVVGVPDDDHQKWDMLAERTGTEVIWARAENDAVVLDAGMQLALKAAAKVDFGAKWDALCANRNTRSSCHAHDRDSKPVLRVKVGRLPGVTGHARTEYYDLLKRQKLLSGTVAELRSIEYANIGVETARVRRDALMEAQAEARGLVAQARREREERETRELIAETLRKNPPAKPIEAVPSEQLPDVPVSVPHKTLPPVAQSQSVSISALAMAQVARDACANPPRPFDKSLALIAWSEVRFAKDIQTSEAGLSACELRVYRRLADFGRSWQSGQEIGADEVRAAVAPPSGGPSSSSGAPRARACWYDSQGNRICEQ